MIHKRLVLFPALCVAFLLASSAASAQNVTDVATGLKAPSKISFSPGGNLLVTEAGTGPNTGRVSRVGRTGGRVTILDGLPSGLTAVGENAPSGPAGIEPFGDAWYLVIGSGDESLPGSTPGAEIPNPNPSSPILSSVLRLRFSTTIDTTIGNFTMTPAQHVALKSGSELAINNPAGETLRVSLLVDFPDLVGPKSSNPFGIQAFGTRLYVVDASQNAIQSVDPTTGAYTTTASFPPLTNPAPPPPVVDAVPDSIRLLNSGFLVSFLTGFPFVPGQSEIRRVDPVSGASQQLIGGLNSAIDVLPVAGGGYLVLEFSTDQSAGAPGRLLYFLNPGVLPSVVAASGLVTPTSMALDRVAREAFVTELATGKVRKITLGGVIGPLPCTAGSNTICLNGGRFQVGASWRSSTTTGGIGTPVQLTDTTGHFWFFSPDNVEVFVKVVRGCAFNNRFWVFAGGMTNVEVTLTVTDMQTGDVRTYINPMNTPFAPIQDTGAFVGCPVTFP